MKSGWLSIVSRINFPGQYAPRLLKAAFLLCILSSLIISFSCGSGSEDAVVLKFAIFGDNQIGYTAWQETKGINPSSANIPQLRQTVADITNTDPLPEVLFILGDLVMNEVMDNGETLQIQLNAWQEVYDSLPGSQMIPLVPIPGNHEFVVYSPLDDNEGPNPGAIDVWVEWFLANGYDTYAGNGPKPEGSNPDLLVRDESMLTYSFTMKGVHFVIINTDTLNPIINPKTKTPLLMQGWIPINWIEDDIRRAQLDRNISTIIVLAHRPIETPYPETTERAIIMNSEEYPFGTRLARVMRENSKVKLFLASHLHRWDSARLEGGNGVMQIIVGNGGSHLDTDWNPEGGVYYGYAIVRVYESGTLIVEDYGRELPPPPQKFYEGEPVPPAPATLRNTIIIQSSS
jgi:hypothetical protein